MQLLDLLNAIAARCERINVASGYSSTPSVVVERAQIDPDTERLPVITVVYEDTSYEREGAVAAGFDATHQITVVGLTRAGFDDRATAPLLLLGDIERALFLPSQDAISSEVTVFEPIRSEIVRPQDGEDVTESLITLRVRTCARVINTAQEQTP